MITQKRKEMMMLKIFLIFFLSVAFMLALIIVWKNFKIIKEKNREEVEYALKNLFDPLDNEQIKNDDQELVLFTINTIRGRILILTKLKNAELYKDKGPSAFPILYDYKTNINGFFLVGLGIGSKFVEPIDFHHIYFNGWPGDNYKNFEKTWEPNTGNIFPISWETISRIY